MLGLGPHRLLLITTGQASAFVFLLDLLVASAVEQAPLPPWPSVPEGIQEGSQGDVRPCLHPQLGIPTPLNNDRENLQAPTPLPIISSRKKEEDFGNF